jgi:hypothetical protein
VRQCRVTNKPTYSQKTRRIVRFNSGIVIDLSFEVDAYRSELGRSPGSRFFGLKLPSQRVCASGVIASLLRAYSGGAAPDLHRIPIQKTES